VCEFLLIEIKLALRLDLKYWCL